MPKKYISNRAHYNNNNNPFNGPLCTKHFPQSMHANYTMEYYLISNHSKDLNPEHASNISNTVCIVRVLLLNHRGRL